MAICQKERPSKKGTLGKSNQAATSLEKASLNTVAYLALLLSTSPLYSPLRRRRGSKIEDAVGGRRQEIPRPAKPGDGGEVITRIAALEAFFDTLQPPDVASLSVRW